MSGFGVFKTYLNIPLAFGAIGLATVLLHAIVRFFHDAHRS
jgi:hypothetical protein